MLVIGVYVLALISGTNLELFLFSFVVDESLPVSSSRDWSGVCSHESVYLSFCSVNDRRKTKC